MPSQQPEPESIIWRWSTCDGVRTACVCMLRALGRYARDSFARSAQVRGPLRHAILVRDGDTQRHKTRPEMCGGRARVRSENVCTRYVCACVRGMCRIVCTPLLGVLFVCSSQRARSSGERQIRAAAQKCCTRVLGVPPHTISYTEIYCVSRTANVQ